MCLAVPAKVIATHEDMATVDIMGVQTKISIVMVDDLHIGDYVLVHVGYALQKIDPAEALITLSMLNT